jgi:hypothetical protein
MDTDCSEYVIPSYPYAYIRYDHTGSNYDISIRVATSTGAYVVDMRSCKPQLFAFVLQIADPTRTIFV